MSDFVVTELISHIHDREKPDCRIVTAWHYICIYTFPTNDYFLDMHELDTDTGVRSDIVATHLLKEEEETDRWQQFLVIECKIARYESDAGAWRATTDKLRRQLESLCRSGRARFVKRFFGIVAIGKLLRFYEYISGEGMRAFEGDEKTYLIDRQCRTVTERVLYIQQHHA